MNATEADDEDAHPFADEWIRDLGYFSSFYCGECEGEVEPGKECCEGAEIVEDTGDDGYAVASALAEPYTGMIIPEDPDVWRAGLRTPYVQLAHGELRQVVIRYQGEVLRLPVWHVDMQPWDTVAPPKRRWHRCWSQTVVASQFAVEHEHRCPCGGRSRDGRSWDQQNTRPAPKKSP